MKTLQYLFLLLSSGSVLAQSSLTAPELLYPEDNGFNWTTADFSWTSSPGASSYQFQISRNSTLFVDIAVDTTVSTTGFTGDIWEPDGWYHWRVRALSLSDSSDWSEVRRFELRFPVDTEHAQPFQSRLSIHPCFPNPVGSTTTLEYEVARPGEVVVALFNINGQQVRHYAIENHEPGAHSVLLGDGAMPPGVYVGRISTGDESRSFTFTVAR